MQRLASRAAHVARVDVAQPFSVRLPSPSPITMNPGSSIPLAFTFRPTAVGVHTKQVTVIATGGEVVLTATLTGEGIASTLPSLIRDARQREGLSLRELAERLGIAPSTVKAWEAGKVSRPTSRVTRLFEEYVKEA